MPPPLLLSTRPHELPKYQYVKQLLLTRLAEMAHGDPLPSLAGMQAEYGVSLGTVDKAVRALRQEGLVDVRHGSGIYATGRRRTLQVGICFGYDVLRAEAGEYPRLLLGGLARAEETTPDVTCRHYFHAGSGDYWQDKFDLLEQDVRAHMIDGVVVIGMYSERIGDLPVPVVALHSIPNAMARVLLDYQDLVRQGVALLAQAGCQRVAYVGSHHEELPPESDPHYVVARDHAQARDLFFAEAKRLGLETCPEWVQGVKDKGGRGAARSEDIGERAVDAMRGVANWPPDGIVCTDDHVSLGICRGLRQVGCVVGTDVLLASHSNRGSSTLAGEAVRCLEFDPDEVAGALMESVRDLIYQRHRVPKTRYIKPKVV